MLVVVDKNNPLVAEAFRQFGEVRALGTREITRETVRDAGILIVRSETKVTKELLDGGAVQFVGTATIGTDHVDIPFLRSRGIGFASAPGSNANSVAEYVAAALLTLAERKKFSLKGRSIGVVGVGNVGSKVVRNALALGMNVLKNDPPLARSSGDPSFLPLDELMNADVITIHVPLTKEGSDPTYHLFDGARVKKMKKGAIIINTARGGVVDNAALKDAIVRGHLGGSVLDVWEGEPGIDVELLKCVDIGTPHIAGYSFDGKLAAVRMTYSAACKHFGQKEVWTPGNSLPRPETDRVVVSPLNGVGEGVLRKILTDCYDIECDDQGLRKIEAVPEAGRRTYFTRLRAEYRVRREFNNTTVELPRQMESLKTSLGSIGFAVEMNKN